jgi:hypothetical protein
VGTINVELLSKLFKRRASLIKYPQPLTGEEVKNIFGDQGEDNKIWQALDTIIDAALLDSVNDVADSKNSPEMFSHSAGKIDALALLKSQIEDYKPWKNGKIFYKKN